MKKIQPQIALGLVQMLLACGGSPTGAGPGPEDGKQEQPGYALQGRGLQGYSLQGSQTAVATVQQIRIGGADVTDVHLTGTLLGGTLGGAPISGTGFVGASVTQQGADGSVSTSTIASVTPDPQDPSGEVLLYALTTQDPNTGAVQEVCAPDASGQSLAIPVRGTWDSSGAHQPSTTQFMFACTSGVIAKCIRWGYKPWKSVNGVSLADYHQACTRMARGDYCGDGVSHTVDNTLIDLYDDLGIQQRSPPQLLSPLLFDAAWTPQGAWCVTKDRWLRISQLATVTLACKLKFLDLFPLLETSPVDPTDLCGVKRSDLSRSSVRMDNRSALNAALF
jgi:hypothetical protein